jgi:methylation protein EvaC
MSYKELTCCRFCNGNVIDFITLGDKLPLAGGFLRDPNDFATEKFYPLTLTHCQQCFTVQCKEVIDDKELFCKGYFYYSSSIPFLVTHFNDYAKELYDIYKPNVSQNIVTVVEMGCNDGVFLRPLHNFGFNVIGIDPSDTCKQLIADGYKIYNTFLNDEVVDKILSEHPKIDIFLSSNSFAHIDDMRTIIRCMKRLLKFDGDAFIEVHYLSAVIDELNFDFIYHEHMSYYSVSSILKLCALFDLTLQEVKLTTVHGKSLRLHIKNRPFYLDTNAHTKNPYYVSENIPLLIEKEANLRDIVQLKQFSQCIYEWRDQFKDMYEKLKLSGYKIYGFGASGRSTTICNFADLDLSIIIDDAKNKIGCYTPKYHAVVVSSDVLYTETPSPPDYVIILAWPYARSIISKNRKFVDNGGKFIIPLPKIKIIDNSNVIEVIGENN